MATLCRSASSLDILPSPAEMRSPSRRIPADLPIFTLPSPRRIKVRRGDSVDGVVRRRRRPRLGAAPHAL
jgi:hypothetical protein